MRFSANGASAGGMSVACRGAMHRIARAWIVVLSLTLAGGALVGCEAQPACGDGVLAEDEACDDVRTPGDDRPGFFYCSPDALTPGVTCAAGTLCCLTGEPRCATREEGCLDPFNVATCDGPEDCTVGNTCWTASHDRACRADGVYAWCHTDRDCGGVSPWLA